MERGLGGVRSDGDPFITAYVHPNHKVTYSGLPRILVLNEVSISCLEQCLTSNKYVDLVNKLILQWILLLLQPPGFEKEVWVDSSLFSLFLSFIRSHPYMHTQRIRKVSSHWSLTSLVHRMCFTCNSDNAPLGLLA